MKKKILIVDDDMSITISLKYLLEELYHPATASSGEEALDKLKKNHYDAVLLDYKMDGMDGLETLRQIRMMKENIVVIMLSAIDNEEIINEAKKLNVNHYLTKPYKKDEILSTLRNNLAA
ncbi:response regulator [candidate division KSB1 bacterium]|nr:response regulator [candidate division KSB1 bacterium]